MEAYNVSLVPAVITMPRALLLLLRLQFRGLLRRGTRGLKTPRGVFFFILAVCVLLLWLGPVLMNAFTADRIDPAIVRAALPPIVLLMAFVTAFTSAGEKAVSFTPAEVDLLFPGPFTRRALLGYKLIKTTAGAAASAVVVSIALLPFAPLWLGGFVGTFASLLFIQLFAMTFILTGRTVIAGAHSTSRRIITICAAAAIAAAVVPAILAALRISDFAQLPAVLEASPAAGILLAPLRPHALAFTASTFGGVAGWGAIALLLNAALLWLVLWLDVNYLEASLAASQRQQDRVQSLRRGQMLGRATAGSARLRLPPFGRFGGAGPIAWRQLTSALRTARALLILLLLFSVAFAPAIYFGRRDAFTAIVLPAAAWLTFVCGGIMRFDFRGDLDRMDVIKALPLHPSAIVVGQLLAPTLLLTCCHMMMLLGAALLHAESRPMLLAGALLAPPVNLLLIESENLLFLLFPTRFAVNTPGDVSALGRQIVLFMLKTAVLAAPLVVAAGAGISVYFATGRSLVAAVAVVAGLLWASAAALLPLLAWAFTRFDPSVHTPP